MKFMILVKSTPDVEARLAATSDAEVEQPMAAMGVFNEEFRKAGVMKDCDGLLRQHIGGCGIVAPWMDDAEDW